MLHPLLYTEIKLSPYHDLHFYPTQASTPWIYTYPYESAFFLVLHGHIALEFYTVQNEGPEPTRFRRVRVDTGATQDEVPVTAHPIAIADLRVNGTVNITDRTYVKASATEGTLILVSKAPLPQPQIVHVIGDKPIYPPVKLPGPPDLPLTSLNPAILPLITQGLLSQTSDS